MKPDEISSFEDILDERKIRNDMVWACKRFRPKQALDSEYGVNPLIHQFRVLMNSNIQELISNDDSQFLIYYKVMDILKEIGYSRDTKVVRILGLLLIKIMKKSLQSVFITEHKLVKLKVNMGKNPIIFLPTHRSYADFILMAFLCFNYDIEIPVVVAGMDFQGMFGVASLLRQCGAMYMRRSFKDDNMYNTVFKTYVKNVIKDGVAPFEFFIEGTRSRTGKSLVPKLGLLKMISEVYSSGDVQEITLFPISISYDRILEDTLFAREVLGIPKPKESTSGLFKALRLLEKQYGNVYINIGQEISLKKFSNSVRGDQLLPLLSHTIVRRQQECAVVTFFNVMCIAVIDIIQEQGSVQIKVTELIKKMEYVEDLITSLGAIMHFKGVTYDEVIRNLNIHFNIFKQADEVIEIVANPKTGVISENDFENLAMNMIMLQHYANPCYHVLIDSAILIRILSVNGKLKQDDLFARFRQFRSLFKDEFVFHVAFEGEDFEKACTKLQDMLILMKDNDIFILTEDHINSVWHNLLLPYLYGYIFIYRTLISVSDVKFEESRLIQRIKSELEFALERNGKICMCYGLSSNFIGCCLSSLNAANIININSAPKNVCVSDRSKLISSMNFLNELFDCARSNSKTASLRCHL